MTTVPDIVDLHPNNDSSDDSKTAVPDIFDLHPNNGSSDDNKTAVPDIVDLHPNNDSSDDVVPEPSPIFPAKDSEKRQFEEPDERDEGEPKRCKTSDNANNVDTTTMSKRQIKKMHKQQMWLEKKALRKEEYKEKKEERKKLKAHMREAGIDLKKAKTTKMAESSCKQRIVLDMSYDDMMSDKDLSKCSNQLLRCYGLNRRMENPMQLYFCSYEGKIKEAMAKHNGSQFWDIKYVEKSFDKVFEKEEIVYLTSDSMNVLDSLDESKVYIIGGLVDHNSCKGASLKVAENHGIAHAKLPIDEYINMKTRKILTINHVYEIISKVVSGVSWKDAFLDTLPKRKICSAKDEETSLDYEDVLNGEQKKEVSNC